MRKNYYFTLMLVLLVKPLFAQDNFIGEVRLFAGNFAPVGWMICDGSLLPISEYDTLFSLIGTTYGGDGETTFALPDLRGRVPVGPGQGPGLSNQNLGAPYGQEKITLTSNNLPSHTHTMQLTVNDGVSKTNLPQANSSLSNSGFNSGRTFIPNASYTTAVPDLNYSATTQNTGQQLPVDNLKPYCAINYIIAVYGIYPSQN